MFKKSLKVKIILPSIIILSVLIVSLNMFLSVRFLFLNDALINEKFEANIKSFHFYLDDKTSNTQMAAVSMSFDADAIKAIRERDTEALLRLFTSKQIPYGVNYYTIADHEGIVLARTHEPDRFGDSILYQQNVKNALAGEVSSYFETGTIVQVSARTAVPVYDTDDSIIGIIITGVRFDSDNEVEKLKKLFEVEVAIFAINTRIATTTTKDEQSIVGMALDPKIEEIIIKNKQEYRGSVDIFGETYKTYYKPLLDPQDKKVFAVFFFGMPTTEVVAASNNVIRDGIICGFIGLVISAILIYSIMSSISEPIIKLTNDMGNIADGNLRVDIKVQSEDEVGHLGRSLQRIANILHKLLDDIHILIAEHKKGNTEYDLNTEEFHGDYKILADNVSKLATFSIKDPLTGIPNRRSFNNRIEMEWNRATREKTPLSILMMDIDKFKEYNDTFGHQQGDLALQSVADTIKRLLIRSTDFVARWGGEEFVVLLPNTNSSGAVGVAEKIRIAIEKSVIPCDDERGAKATISIGVHTLIPEQSCSICDFISAADSALYEAKEAGRNSVCRHGTNTGPI